jgi:hypothetical protein
MGVSVIAELARAVRVTHNHTERAVEGTTKGQHRLKQPAEIPIQKLKLSRRPLKRGVPNGIRTRLLALKGLPGNRTFAKKHSYFLRQRTLAGKGSITVCHSLSSSDYLERPQKRPHVAAKLQDGRVVCSRVTPLHVVPRPMKGRYSWPFR